MKKSRWTGRLLSALLITMLCALGVLLGGCDVAEELLFSAAETAVETDALKGFEEEQAEAWSEENQIQTKSEEEQTQTKSEERQTQTQKEIAEDGRYTSPEQVALYLHRYGHLPSNYITKRDAEELGWDSSKGNLWDVADGMSIGGSRFGNYEELLPEKQGRKWYECDVNYKGGYRGAERIVYSNDGLIYYTKDHYETFKQLY